MNELKLKIKVGQNEYKHVICSYLFDSPAASFAI